MRDEEAFEHCTVNSSKEKLLRLDDLEELLYVGEDLQDHLLLCELYIGVIAVCTVVNDAIHVQVEVVNDWHMRAGNGLVD